MRMRYLLFMASAVASTPLPEPKHVFAHFIIGNAASMTRTEWESDIKLAKDAHIDGFALNIAPQDTYTDAVLQNAYDAASSIGNFTLFLSFDYLSGGPWPVDRVIKTVNTYKNNPAQFNYHDKPFVSTFEGVNNFQDWPSIKASTGCFFVPSWTSIGPEGLKGVMDTIDGAFSWDAWAEGAASKSPDSDEAWMNVLGDKPYMMPVAPWFYTNLPQWGKNWLWRGDDLWYDRWQQAIELQPAMVEIITWNDYGEAHYIGPIHESGIPDGAAEYVLGHPHDAWRALLPIYIDAYKSGNPTTKPEKTALKSSQPTGSKIPTDANPLTSRVTDTITYWYRLNPSTAGSDGGTTGNNPSQGQLPLDPSVVSQDRIFMSILVSAPSDVTVRVGVFPETRLRANAVGINHFSVPFAEHRGPVWIAVWRDGEIVASTMGPEITDKCVNGKINWNAFVGSSLDA